MKIPLAIDLVLVIAVSIWGYLLASIPQYKPCNGDTTIIAGIYRKCGVYIGISLLVLIRIGKGSKANQSQGAKDEEGTAQSNSDHLEDMV